MTAPYWWEEPNNALMLMIALHRGIDNYIFGVYREHRFRYDRPGEWHQTTFRIEIKREARLT